MNRNQYIVKKECTFLSVLKTLFVLATIAYAAYKIYEKFFKSKLEAAKTADEVSAPADVAENTEDADNALEVGAEDAITGSESESVAE